MKRKWKKKFEKSIEKATKAPPKHGFGKKYEEVKYKTASGQMAVRHQLVGRKMPEYPTFKVPQENTMQYDVNWKNPLLSTGTHTGEGVRKFAVNLETGEFIISPGMEMHAKTLHRVGEKQFDTYIRGIYNANQNVIGLRTPVGDEDYKKQYAVFKMLRKENPALKCAIDVRNEDLDTLENFDEAKFLESKGKKGVIWNEMDDPRYHKFEFEMAITPAIDADQFDKPEQVVKAFQEPKYKAFEKEVYAMAKSLGVKISQVDYNLGKFNDRIEPSFTFSVSGSKTKLQRLVELGKKYEQHQVIFSRKGNMNLGAKVVLENNVEVKKIVQMLSETRFVGYTFAMNQHNGKSEGKREILLFQDTYNGETPEQFRAKANKFISTCLKSQMLKEHTFENLNTTFVDIDNKDEYQAYLKGAKFFKAEDEIVEGRLVFFGGGGAKAQKESEDMQEKIWTTIAKEAKNAIS